MVSLTTASINEGEYACSDTVWNTPLSGRCQYFILLYRLEYVPISASHVR